MILEALDFCLSLHHANALMHARLDEELGAYHGISFGDLALLRLIANADSGRVEISELVRQVGLSQSVLLRQLISLEKIGLVTRTNTNDLRHALVRPAGRELVKVASETAEGVCAEVVQIVAPVMGASAAAAMESSTRKKKFADT